MTALTYWQDNSPFVMRSVIRAQPMNTKMGGISANLQQITAKINGFVVKLPDNFTGNTEIPTQPYANKLLYINKDGDVDLLDKNVLTGEADNDVTIVTDSTNALSVNADNHSQFFDMNYVMPDNPTDAESKILITVGSGLRTIDGDLTAVPGSLVFFTNNSDAEMWLVPDENLGITIDSPGTLRAYGKHSSLVIMAISETKWLLMGDMYINDVDVVDGVTPDSALVSSPTWTSDIYVNSITHYWPVSLEFRSNGDAHPMYSEGLEYDEDIHANNLSPSNTFRWLVDGAPAAVDGQYEIRFALVSKTGDQPGGNELKLYDGADSWRPLVFDSVSTLNDPCFFDGDAVIPYADISGYIYSSVEPTITVLMEIREVSNPANIISGELFTKQGQVPE